MMTKGEYRVGKTFNPSNDDMVAAIKSVAADFIVLGMTETVALFVMVFLLTVKF